MTKCYYSLLLSSFLIITSCNSNKTLTSDTIYEAPFDLEEEMLDTLVVSAYAETSEPTETSEPPQAPLQNGLNPYGYNGSAERTFDLLHTSLKVAFDWDNQHVLGEADLTLKPLFYSTSKLELDAKNFDIHHIMLNDEKLTYDYDGSVLKIDLDKVYTREDKLTLNIGYTAKPNEGASGGSQAITSDKGLFFINPKNENKFKPQQIWTQGETENSSRWFPTIDKPNERCSQEVYLTVQDRFKTLSNGLLLSSNKNDDGTRTDHWKQEQPHAPYLFMLGIGEYAIVKGKWRDKELLYYVEPEYEEHATKIFNHTPEMLDFFSDILGYPYPWDKYAQIVCRDYVSGAMENTGAVVFGDFVQKTSRELIDANNDDIVAHEMFHHWFGDLVTCESWSNLTLNEGFATYSEYLWQEYKYGKEVAERKRIEDLNGYLMTADRGGTHDLIHFEYKDKEDMFDGHSYNKGGLIIHMLRNYVGDEAFYASLKKYLTDNAYTDVEAHELRLTFEDVTGKDLNWFFNQWFFDKGHPLLDIVYNIDKENKKVIINVDQTQDPEDNVPVFILPMSTMLYYASGKKEEIPVVINQRSQTIEIHIKGDEMPLVAVLDGKHDILSVNTENRTDKDYVNLFYHSDEYVDKLIAVTKLSGKQIGTDILKASIKSTSAEMRLIGVNSLDNLSDKTVLKDLALHDPSGLIRKTALKKLRSYKVALSLVQSDESYEVVGEALRIVNETNPKQGLTQAAELTKSYHKPLLGAIGDIFASSKDTQYLNYFEDNIDKVDMFSFFNFIGQYGKLAKLCPPQRMEETADILKSVAMEDNSAYFKKYASTNLIQSLITELQQREDEDQDTKDAVIKTLYGHITTIVNTSTDQRLRNAFSQHVDRP